MKDARTEPQRPQDLSEPSAGTSARVASFKHAARPLLRRDWAVLALMLVVGIFASVMAGLWGAELYRSWALTTFRADAGQAATQTQSEIEDAIDAVYSIATWYQLDDHLSPGEFEHLANSLIGRRGMALAGLGWAPVVADGDVVEFEARMVGNGGDRLRVVEPGAGGELVAVSGRAAYMPLAEIEPHGAHGPVRGIDLLSGAPAMAPIRRALEQSEAVLCGPIAMRWVEGSPRAFVAIVPVVDGKGQRGCVLGFIRTDTVCERVPVLMRESQLMVSLHLPTPAAGMPALESRGGGAPIRASRIGPSARHGPKGFIQTEPVEFLGAGGTIGVVGDEVFYLRRRGVVKWGLILAGTLLSVAVTALVGARQAMSRTSRRIALQSRQLARANESLRLSEDRYRLAVEAVAGIVYDYDIASGRVQRSAGTLGMIGYRPEELSPDAAGWLGVVHPDDLGPMQERFGAALEKGEGYSLEYRVVHRDGRALEVWDRGVIVRDAGGAPRRCVGCIFDVSERHRIERAVRQQEHLLRTTFDSLKEGCIVLSATGGFVDCNTSAEEILGVTRAQLESQSIQSMPWETFRPDGTPMPREEYAASRALRTGEPVEGVLVGWVRPDGQRRWIMSNARPLRDATGAIDGVVGSFSDVTDRRAASLLIEETARKYELLFDANPEPLMVYDRETMRFRAVNQAAINMYGFTREEFLGMTALELRPEEEVERFLQYVSRDNDAPRTGSTWRHRRRDGSLIDVEVVSHPIDFGGRPARIVLAKDITDRLRAERALLESESRLREAQRIGRLGDWEYDLVTGEITWSEQAYRLFEREVAAGPPGFEENMAYYFPEDRARLKAAVEEAARTGRGSEQDLHLRLPSGAEAWHRGVITAEKDQSGAVVRLRGTAQDITERKLAEEALRRTQLRLAVVLNNLPDVVVYESEGDRLFASENIVRLIGAPASAFENDRAAFTRLVHPLDLPEMERRIGSLRAGPGGGMVSLQYRVRERDGSYLWIEDRMVLERLPDDRARTAGVMINITELKRAEQRQRLMMAELDHRVKNNLATVISLLEQTARSSASVQQFQQTFTGRIMALARMHKALSGAQWEGIGLLLLVTQTLEPYQSDPPGRVRIESPDVTLPARAATALAMALHELATNAAKYGALSSPAGRVRVSWVVRGQADGAESLAIDWEESGGPPVVPPESLGFGTELIEGGIAYELQGTAKIDFHPDGVRCTMTIPLSGLPSARIPEITEV